jgi:hypothetical protein
MSAVNRSGHVEVTLRAQHCQLFMVRHRQRPDLTKCFALCFNEYVHIIRHRCGQAPAGEVRRNVLVCRRMSEIACCCRMV